MNSIKFLQLWSVAVGVMDASTGLLLIFIPALTLRLMGVPEIDPGALVFLSWMGVFIAAVGLSYGLVFRGNREGECVWIFTASVRLMVAAFLIWKISNGALPQAWGLVALTDLVVATGQGVLLARGAWKGGGG